MAAGAVAMEAAGAGLILMDDGFQNPSLAKTVSLLVIDAAQGFGNGLCLPAGPLREPAGRALGRADAIILVGEGPFRPETAKPVFRARIAVAEGTSELKGRVVAFAGIGRPEKFFDTLRAAGAELVSTHAFPDHHPFQEGELEAIAAGLENEALLMTTEKDWVRLPPVWQSRVAALPVSMQFEDKTGLERFLRARLEAA
jgi:tetraacyldisaccharide 4'-kinase